MLYYCTPMVNLPCVTLCSAGGSFGRTLGCPRAGSPTPARRTPSMSRGAVLARPGPSLRSDPCHSPRPVRPGRGALLTRAPHCDRQSPIEKQPQRAWCRADVGGDGTLCDSALMRPTPAAPPVANFCTARPPRGPHHHPPSSHPAVPRWAVGVWPSTPLYGSALAPTHASATPSRWTSCSACACVQPRASTRW